MDKVNENLLLNSGEHIPDISVKCESCINNCFLPDDYPCLYCAWNYDDYLSDLLVKRSFYECW